ncbi:hypothetical protein BYT27DRAFT_7229224 [Phlegmacium glaucopus]|nr:hypothetical protein BYT27DRAFT_7229224 [Phlegmacium glaucopus]
MHCRNPYSNPPDFLALAAEYQDTSSRPRTTINFRNEAAQRRLTEAIMFCHFSITLRIPENRLCPPMVKSHRMDHRLNYILWIQEIVHAHDYVFGNPRRRVRGIDIGTGSTAIYHFLGCKLEPEWEFVATELDDISYDCASENPNTNNMQSRVRLEKATGEGKVAQSASEKDLAPNAVCTGADIEMIFADGGEEGFVGQMVEESERFQTRCKWYTSMLGKMSSVTTVVENLRKRSIVNYAITEFVQGQTRRWAVGWSFIDMHLPDSIARIPSIVAGHPLYLLMPPRNTLTQSFPNCSVPMLADILDRNLRLLEGVSATNKDPGSVSNTVSSSSASRTLFLEAEGNTWSRSARRRRRLNGSTPLENTNTRTSSSSSRQPALTCSVRVIDTLPRTMETSLELEF